MQVQHRKTPSVINFDARVLRGSPVKYQRRNSLIFPMEKPKTGQLLQKLKQHTLQRLQDKQIEFKNIISPIESTHKRNSYEEFRDVFGNILNSNDTFEKLSKETKMLNFLRRSWKHQNKTLESGEQRLPSFFLSNIHKHDQIIPKQSIKTLQINYHCLKNQKKFELNFTQNDSKTKSLTHPDHKHTQSPYKFQKEHY